MEKLDRTRKIKRVVAVRAEEKPVKEPASSPIVISYAELSADHPREPKHMAMSGTNQKFYQRAWFWVMLLFLAAAAFLLYQNI